MSRTSSPALRRPSASAVPVTAPASADRSDHRNDGPALAAEQRTVLNLRRQARLMPAPWLMVEVVRRGPVPAWLDQAGLAEEVSVEDVARMKALFGLVLGLVGLAFAVLIRQPLYGVLIVVGLVTLGLVLPERTIRSAASMRQRRLARVLPLALEVIGLTVERTSMDAAIEHYCRHFSDTVLAHELAQAMDRVKKFKERLDVELGRVLRRNGNEDLSFLVAAVGQASQVGGRDLRELLTRQASQLREKQALETKAQSLRAPVLMAFPIMLNVIALLVVLGGLAAAQLFFSSK